MSLYLFFLLCFADPHAGWVWLAVARGLIDVPLPNLAVDGVNGRKLGLLVLGVAIHLEDGVDRQVQPEGVELVLEDFLCLSEWLVVEGVAFERLRLPVGVSTLTTALNLQSLQWETWSRGEKGVATMVGVAMNKVGVTINS